MLENGSTSGCSSIPSEFGHEPPPRLDARPCLRVGCRERVTERRVGEGDAVLDVGREVVRPGRRDDVDLEGHARAQLHLRSGRDRRVDPLVEMDLVPGVQEDPEERVAEPAVDDLLERPARLPDADRAIPLGDRLEIRSHELLDVVADARRQLAGILDDEPGPAVQRAPHAECHREPVSALDPARARAEQAVAWRAVRPSA